MEQSLQIIYEKLESIEKRLDAECKTTMSVDEYAKHSGIGENKIRELIASKVFTFPCFWIGSRVRINVRKADAFLDLLSEEQTAV